MACCANSRRRFMMDERIFMSCKKLYNERINELRVPRPRAMVIANSHSETHSCIVGLRSLKHWRHTRTASRQLPAETDESDILAYCKTYFDSAGKLQWVSDHSLWFQLSVTSKFVVMVRLHTSLHVENWCWKGVFTWLVGQMWSTQHE